ncbi:GNAT family N-acetyltransferase [Ovoidimarina sediminis]|uniref:GNAT family N-acetyltransferase n=1 Tax=Ovoidimarina sediminis TaxID=3079856 RepID=UPI00291396B2|nr:GNAT family N-acetyltransferase [Rhodophyticola sp. MJ-SS7]MDU8945913.1 GNAT family N-acetyltransferase [Rhodophyticola sp. MJ-SS7]
MTLPGQASLEQALELSWPPKHAWTNGPWRLREGAGGGKRVSAATALGPVSASDMAIAEAEMQRLEQPRLFRSAAPDDPMSRQLEARGYEIVDPTLFYATPSARLLNPNQRPLDAIPSDACLGIHAEIWAAGGIGPARLQVMERATTPKCWLLARLSGRAAGSAFVSLAGRIAMIHAIEVRPEARRRGAARAMLHRAAAWATEQGADTLALAVTAANGPANTLYASLGMRAVGQYHYQIHPEDA